MEAISVIAGLLLVVVWIGVIVGLINPKWLQGKKENSKLMTRKEIAWGGLGATILLGIIGVATSPTPATAPESATAEKIAEPQAVVVPEVSKEPLKEIKAETNLGMTPEEFRQKFNKRLNDLDITIVRPLAEFNVKNGEVRDVFQVSFSDNLSLTGAVNKDGMLHDLTFIVLPGENSERAMMEALIVIGASSNVVNATSDKEKIGKTVTDLISKALKGLDKEKNDHSQIIGDVKYYSLASKYTGLWFGMTPVEE